MLTATPVVKFILVGFNQGLALVVSVTAICDMLYFILVIGHASALTVELLLLNASGVS